MSHARAASSARPKSSTRRIFPVFVFLLGLGAQALGKVAALARTPAAPSVVGIPAVTCPAAMTRCYPPHVRVASSSPRSRSKSP